MDLDAPLTSFSVVPDLGDIDFSLGTIDTFGEIDLDMESFNLIDDTYPADPFSNLSFEQSLSLVSLAGSEADDSSILDDFDVKEPIRQDCMWSAFQDASRNRSVHVKRQRGRSESAGLCTTPPSSYISSHLTTFHTPLHSEDESSEEVEVMSPLALRLSGDLGDHCYTSTSSPSPWSTTTSAGAPLTPPESSEDEDSSSLHLSPSSSSSSLHHAIHIANSQAAARKKAGLSEVKNDRFNEVVRNIRLKNKSRSGRSALTELRAGRTKFRFSVTTRNKSSLLAPGSRGAPAYQQENKQGRRLEAKQRRRLEEVRAKPEVREARDVHNQMERQRRTDLKNAFDSLKDFVPTIANSDRASKQMVLDKAIDYCKNLRSREARVRGERAGLAARNASLRARLQELEAAAASRALDTAAWTIQDW